MRFVDTTGWTGRVTALSVAVLCAGAAMLTGCSTYDPGGSGFTDGVQTYQSTPHEPKTITLVDTRTGQTVWTYEIPVGRQLTLRFFEGREPENASTPDEMVWEDLEMGTLWGNLDNTLLVPDHRSRRLDMTIRTSPEMPGTNTRPSAFASPRNP